MIRSVAPGPTGSGPGGSTVVPYGTAGSQAEPEAALALTSGAAWEVRNKFGMIHCGCSERRGLLRGGRMAVGWD
eukprot:765790-Hanusia_phi.AAC.1